MLKQGTVGALIIASLLAGACGGKPAPLAAAGAPPLTRIGLQLAAGSAAVVRRDATIVAFRVVGLHAAITAVRGQHAR